MKNSLSGDRTNVELSALKRTLIRRQRPVELEKVGFSPIGFGKDSIPPGVGFTAGDFGLALSIRHQLDHRPVGPCARTRCAASSPRDRSSVASRSRSARIRSNVASRFCSGRSFGSASRRSRRCLAPAPACVATVRDVVHQGRPVVRKHRVRRHRAHLFTDGGVQNQLSSRSARLAMVAMPSAWRNCTTSEIRHRANARSTTSRRSSSGVTSSGLRLKRRVSGRHTARRSWIKGILKVEPGFLFDRLDLAELQHERLLALIYDEDRRTGQAMPLRRCYGDQQRGFLHCVVPSEAEVGFGRRSSFRGR